MVRLSDEIALARGLKMQRAAMINPLVGEIAETLLELGGAAHRDRVIDQLAMDRSGFAASPAFRQEVIQAFQIHCDGAAARGELPILRLPFGEGSHRWGLTLDAHAHLHGAVRRRAE